MSPVERYRNLREPRSTLEDRADTLLDRDRASVEVRAEPTLDAEVLGREDQQTRVGALRSLFASYAITTTLNLLSMTRILPDAGFGSPFLTAFAAANLILVGALFLVARKKAYGNVISAGVGISSASFCLAAAVYLGTDNSVVVVGLPVLVYYFGLGDSAARRNAVVGFILAGYVAVLVLGLVGAIPLEGLLAAGSPARRHDPRRIVVFAVFVVQVLALTHWLARKSRRTTLLAMTALERAHRRIGQRDALLEEANANLDRVMNGARVGRLTGHNVGSFEVGRIIGRGGVGEVYEAIEGATGRRVALKVLHAHLEVEPGQLERFEREVKVTQALRSPYVPEIFASGETPEGSRWFAMELLVGCDLATDLRQRTRLPLAEIDDLVFQVGQGLASAHHAGVVHRDIKPQNLFIVRGAKPTWKVLDFGVSKLVVSSGTLTQGAAIGTPGYMAPEQAKGLGVDARADVFSFGAVVYRALTGQPAFRGPSQLTTMMEVIRSQPQRPGEFADVPDDIDAVLALALAKDKETRFESANSFVVAWRDARRGALQTSLREAAKRILAAQPWGADLERDEATSIIAREG